MYSPALYALLPIFLSLTPPVAAHGYIRSVVINGQKFDGPIPNNSQGLQSPVRAITDVSPVKGATTRAINCGQNGQPSALAPEADPGSILTFDWASGESGSWPHNTGPILTYMAPCGDAGCAAFDPIDANWIKIQQEGRKNDGSGEWVQQNLFNGQTIDVRLPTALPPGQYLVRHEIIGLHLASNFFGAEFYPSCTAITLTNKANNDNEATRNNLRNAATVRLPGGYTDNDAGILVNPFNAQADYIFPGPPVFNPEFNGPFDNAPTGVAPPPAAEPTPPTGGEEGVVTVTVTVAPSPVFTNTLAEPTRTVTVTATAIAEAPSSTTSPDPCAGLKKRMHKRFGSASHDQAQKRHEGHCDEGEGNGNGKVVQFEPVKGNADSSVTYRPIIVSRMMRFAH